MAAPAQAGREVDLGLFSTPGELKAAADALDAQITNTDNVIDGNMDIPQALWDGFQEFRGRWKGWYHENFDSPVLSWLTTRLGSLSDQLQGFIADAQTYGLQLQRYGTEVPGGLLSPEKPFSLDDLTKPLAEGFGSTFAIVVGILAVLSFFYFKGEG